MKGAQYKLCNFCRKLRPLPYAKCAQKKLGFCTSCYQAWLAQRVDEELEERRRESKRPDIVATLGQASEALVDRIIEAEGRAWPND